jgi:hypothetical protein
MRKTEFTLSIVCLLGVAFLGVIQGIFIAVGFLVTIEPGLAGLETWGTTLEHSGRLIILATVGGVMRQRPVSSCRAFSGDPIWVQM